MNPFCEISPRAWEIVHQDLAEYLTQYGRREPLWFIFALLFGIVIYCSTKVSAHRRRLDDFVEFVIAHRAKVIPLMLLLSFGASILVNNIYLGGIPHVLDSLAHQFQAKVLASGRLYAPIPPAPLDRALDIQFLQKHGGKLFSRTMPLFPMLLAMSLKFSFIPLLNPFLNLVSLVFIYYILKKQFGIVGGLLGLLLLTTSPFIVFMGASMMGHPTSLLCSAIVLYGFSSYLRKNDSIGLLLVSLGAGLFALERPYSGFVILLPLSIVLLTTIWRLAKEVKTKLLHTVLLALPLLLFLLFLGWYNNELTGSPWTLPRMLSEPYDTPGFGPDKGTPGNPNGHNAIRGLANTSIALAVLSDDLFGWPGLCLFPAFVGLLFPLEKRRDIFVNVVRGTVPLFFFAYFIFHGQGLYFGARYYYCLIPQLIVLTVIGLERMAGEEGEKSANLGLIIFTLTIVSLMTYYPQRLPIFSAYGGISSDAALVATRFTKDCVVLLPRGPNLKHLYLSFASFNSPFLDEGPLFMRDLPELTNEKLKELLPHLPKVIRAKFPKNRLSTNKGAPE